MKSAFSRSKRDFSSSERHVRIHVLVVFLTLSDVPKSFQTTAAILLLQSFIFPLLHIIN